jgi:GNAT superfamily N-acetyltransferase
MPALMTLIEAVGLFPPDEIEDLRGMLTDYFAGTGGDDHFWITDDDEGLAGVAYYAPERMTEGTWNLYFIGVHPDRRREGRASALLDYVEEALAARGERLLLVETSSLPAFGRALGALPQVRLRRGSAHPRLLRGGLRQDRFPQSADSQAVENQKLRPQGPLPLRDGQVVDAGKAFAHQPVFIKLPEFIAVRAKPLPGMVVPFVLEAHGHPVFPETPQRFPEPVAQFTCPLALQKPLYFLPPAEELGAVAPFGIYRVGQANPFGVFAVPGIFGGLYFERSRLRGEGWFDDIHQWQG